MTSEYRNLTNSLEIFRICLCDMIYRCMYIATTCFQSANGNLSYLDVSVGQRIARIPVHHGRLDVMCQNPHNAIIHLGHTSGKSSTLLKEHRDI